MTDFWLSFGRNLGFMQIFCGLSQILRGLEGEANQADIMSREIMNRETMYRETLFFFQWVANSHVGSYFLVRREKWHLVGQ